MVMKKFLKWGLIVFLAFIVIGALAGDDAENTSNGTNDSQKTNTEVVEQQVEESPKFDASLPHFEDGTHRVGEDIEPGTYRAVDADGCYYERLAGFSGSFGDILANDNPKGPAVVEIKEGDAGFKSRGCGTWTQDLSQITGSMTEFGAGTYIVGTDIEPGQYRNEASSGCYYARLSNFSGGMGSILANDNSDDQVIVTILPTDKGFLSNRCGTWKKLE